MREKRDPVPGIVPAQHSGGRSGAGHMLDLGSEDKAREKFTSAVLRLKDVNKWGELSGAGSADFRLTNAVGDLVHRDPEEGDLIRIDLPGPGIRAGNGYDWVRVEDIVDSRENGVFIFAIRVRPVAAPGSNDPASAHFYTGSATSTFMIKMQGTKVSASEEGRNEKLNTDVEDLADKVRNAFIVAGAQAGLAGVQWKKLVKGILE